MCNAIPVDFRSPKIMAPVETNYVSQAEKQPRRDNSRISEQCSRPMRMYLNNRSNRYCFFTLCNIVFILTPDDHWREQKDILYNNVDLRFADGSNLPARKAFHARFRAIAISSIWY